MTLLKQVEIVSELDLKIHPQLRKGQSLMNALGKINLDVYSGITGSEYDCFYDDKKIDNFKKFLSKIE